MPVILFHYQEAASTSLVLHLSLSECGDFGEYSLYKEEWSTSEKKATQNADLVISLCDALTSTRNTVSKTIGGHESLSCASIHGHRQVAYDGFTAHK
jgi:hypothetical protein